MKERRFGRAIKMPSTLQLKHQILRDRFNEIQKAAGLDADSVKKTGVAPEKVKP